MLKWIDSHPRTVFYTAVLIVISLARIQVWHYFHPSESIMTQAQVADPQTVAQKLDVSQPVAVRIVHEIQTVVEREPAVTYQVQATTPAAAAHIVEKQIQANTAPVTLPPADKTIVTPQTQKVDVYRVNLDKPHGIGVYASSQSVGAVVQYKNTFIFGGPRYQGGYEVGAGYLMRF